MASGINTGTADLDDVFKARLSAKRDDVGISVNGTDISNRYEKLTSPSHAIPTDTKLFSGTTDLRWLFMDIDFLQISANITTNPETPSTYQSTNNGSIVCEFNVRNSSKVTHRIISSNIGGQNSEAITTAGSVSFRRGSLSSGNYTVMFRDVVANITDTRTISVPYGGSGTTQNFTFSGRTWTVVTTPETASTYGDSDNGSITTSTSNTSNYSPILMGRISFTIESTTTSFWVYPSDTTISFKSGSKNSAVYSVLLTDMFRPLSSPWLDVTVTYGAGTRSYALVV